MNLTSKKEHGVVDTDKKDTSFKRRAFLKYSGASVAAGAVVLAGCEDLSLSPDKDNQNGNTRILQDGSIDLGSGDIGILNYAYALEQLEAAFYTMAVEASSFNSIYNEEEKMTLKEVMEDEVIHREFYKTALGNQAIPQLTPDFSGINFNDRESVLMAAKTFEDTGVAAYNGAGRLLKDVNLLLVAGKVVSVEGRHASVVRDLLNPLSTDFAGDDVVNETGLDVAMMPMEILPKVQPFIKEKLNGSNLPTE
jgi:hypothetical protein